MLAMGLCCTCLLERGALQLVTSCQFSELSNSPGSTAVAGHIDRTVHCKVNPVCLASHVRAETKTMVELRV